MRSASLPSSLRPAVCCSRVWMKGNKSVYKGPLCVVMKSRKRQSGTDIAELSSAAAEVARSLNKGNSICLLGATP